MPNNKIRNKLMNIKFRAEHRLLQIFVFFVFLAIFFNKYFVKINKNLTKKFVRKCKNATPISGIKYNNYQLDNKNNA